MEEGNLTKKKLCSSKWNSNMLGFLMRIMVFGSPEKIINLKTLTTPELQGTMQKDLRK